MRTKQRARLLWQVQHNYPNAFYGNEVCINYPSKCHTGVTLWHKEPTWFVFCTLTRLVMGVGRLQEGVFQAEAIIWSSNCVYCLPSSVFIDDWSTAKKNNGDRVFQLIRHERFHKPTLCSWVLIIIVRGTCIHNKMPMATKSNTSSQTYSQFFV